MLSYKGLTKSFNGYKVVNNINLEISNGTILGFLGPNGAGKTTTIKMSCGLINPTSGDIEYNNCSLKQDRNNYIKNIGAVLEGNRNIYWKLTPVENMEYFAGLRGLSRRKVKDKIDEFLEVFDLKEKRNVECGKLSRGMQQKVAIACGIIHNPKILFLDEPTLGLDIQSVLSMEEVLKKIISKDRVMIITSHDLKFISALCDRVAIINKGKIILDRDIEFLKDYKDYCTYVFTISKITEKVKKKILEVFSVNFCICQLKIPLYFN
jgi:ABC-2 type transport system ATP-binding protein